MAKEDDDSGPGIDPTAWMATMSDLVFLLITFFVLLISMSAMDTKYLKEAFGLLSGGTAILPFDGNAPSPSKTRLNLILSPLVNSFPSTKNPSYTKPRILRPEEARALLKAIAAGLTGSIPGKELQSTLKSLAAKTDG
ncbi:MAG: flagellar motor protein MotB [Myxococcota bacterium]|nr:flagellar motor protein MotB [Myxococcota bacterium]